MTENVFREYKHLKNLLQQEERDLLKELAEIKRKENKVWGV
jgi:hypothetical protein